MKKVLALAFLAFCVAACSGGDEDDGGNDAGSDTSDDTGGTDAGDDTGGTDAGDDTGGTDAGDDTGGTDAGDDTGGTDAGDDTGGTDTGDAGSCDSESPACPGGCGAEQFCDIDCTCQDFTVDDWWESDSDARIEAANACSDLALALETHWEGQLPFSELLPGSVMLVMSDHFERSRYDAATAYVGAVLTEVHYQRYENALAYGDFASFDRDVQEFIVTGVFLADTRIEIEAVADELEALCPGIEIPARDKADIPQNATSRYGFFCPQPGIPDCGAPEPTPPHDCPPELLDCPDCPYLEFAEDDLDALEDAYEEFEARADGERLLDLLGIYIESLIETAATGMIPNPASIAADIATVYLGEDYPGLALIIDVMANVAAGTLAGGPVVGVAMGLWAGFTSWGDLNEQDSWNTRLAEARARVRAMREYCRQRMWAERQEECRIREAARFERRTAECAESQLSYEAALSQWEADNDACDERQAEAEAARAEAFTITNYLRGKGYGFTRAAFEECCDGPYPFDEACPADLERDPIPIWGIDPRRDWLRQSEIRRLNSRGFGPDAGGQITIEVRIGLPGEPSFTPEELGFDISINDSWIESGGFRGDFGVDDFGSLTGDEATYDVEITTLSADPFGPDATQSADWWYDVTFEGINTQIVILDVATIEDNSSEFHPMVVTSDGVFDLSDGGDFTDATPYAWSDDDFHALFVLDGGLFVSTDTALFDISDGGDVTSDIPWATFPAGALITGTHVDHDGDVWVTDLLGGSVYEISDSGDYSSATPTLSGLSYPVDVILYDDRVLVAENGRSRVADMTSDPNGATAPTWALLDPYGPQHFVYHPWRSLYVTAAAPPDGDGAVFDITASGDPSSASFEGLFNPSGFALHPDGVTWLATEFQEDGSVVDLSRADAGGDLTGAERFATGLDNAAGLTFWFRRDSAFDE